MFPSKAEPLRGVWLLGASGASCFPVWHGTVGSRQAPGSREVPEELCPTGGHGLFPAAGIKK